MKKKEPDDFYDILNSLYENIAVSPQSQKFDHSNPEKLIDCPHEIIFKITANVLEQNQAGEVTASKEICSKNYHIPVPSGSPYKDYMNSFFGFLENCLLESADQTYTGESDNEKDKK